MLRNRSSYCGEVIDFGGSCGQAEVRRLVLKERVPLTSAKLLL